MLVEYRVDFWLESKPSHVQYFVSANNADEAYQQAYQQCAADHGPAREGEDCCIYVRNPRTVVWCGITYKKDGWVPDYFLADFTNLPTVKSTEIQ